MAPFSEAVNAHPTASPVREGNAVVYEGVMDPTWNIGNVPCGGYALALILEACIQHQARTAHVDPLHVSAHFLRPTSSTIPFNVRVVTLKTGRGFTNLTAELIQGDVLKVAAHTIFGQNKPGPDGSLVLEVPSPYARRIPIHAHPSETKVVPMRPGWSFGNNVQWAFDTQTVERNSTNHPNRTSSVTVGGGGLEWSGWFQFQQQTEKLSNVYIPFLVDMFVNTLLLLPKEERGSQTGINWFPTMTLAVDFKFPVSKLSAEHHAERTVGLYSSGRFVNNPSGRHDIYVEVWSAPSNIGEGSSGDGDAWRDKQICLATATQMALIVPIEVNMRANGQQTKL